MPGVQTVNTFTAPPDWQAEAQDIERRRQLAQLLTQQGMQPLEAPPTAGGYTIPISPFAGLAKMLQAYSGAKGQETATQQQRDLYKRQQDVYSKAGSDLMEAVTPRAASPEIPTPSAELGGGPGAPARPAFNPGMNELMAAQMKYTGDIGRPDLGAQFAMSHAQNAMLANMLTGGGMSGGQPSSGGAAPDSNGQPSAQSMIDLVPKQDALRLMLVDPSGKLLAEEASKRYAASRTLTRVNPGGSAVNQAGAPVFTAPTNEGRLTTFGPSGPSQSLVPGATGVTSALANVPKADAPMTKIKLSNQRELELTQPEYLTYTNSGGKILPSRYQELSGELPGVQFGEGGAPQPMGRTAPPKPGDPDYAAYQSVASGAVPSAWGPQPGVRPERAIVGSTQSQAEQIQQAGQTAFAKSKGEGQGAQAADRPTATLAMNDAASNLDRLASHAEALMNHAGIGRITGIPGMLPNVPGMAGADAQAKLDTLKSQAAFTVLQAMRQASKTGGALGQVSDREELMLANNLAALQNSQSTQALKDNLQRIVDWTHGAKARMQNAYDMTYKGAEAAAPAGTASLPASKPHTDGWAVVR